MVRKNKSVKFNENNNQEILFERYSWEKKKTIHDLIKNSQKQTIQKNKGVCILEEYAKRNPNVRFVFGARK
jgi:hypothetical protein